MLISLIAVIISQCVCYQHFPLYILNTQFSCVSKARKKCTNRQTKILFVRFTPIVCVVLIHVIFFFK